MIEIKHPYIVIDTNGVEWGEVTLISEHSGKFHGYLKPTQEFQEIFPIFEKHERLMSEGGFIDAELEASAQEIINLRPALHSSVSRPESAGIVFISKTSHGMLFTCGR